MHPKDILYTHHPERKFSLRGPGLSFWGLRVQVAWAGVLPPHGRRPRAVRAAGLDGPRRELGEGRAVRCLGPWEMESFRHCSVHGISDSASLHTK